MTITVDAVYENGVLKLAEPLPLAEHVKVQVTVHTTVSRVRATSGLIGWTGDAATIERIALDPEFSIEESR
jgi:predicted DNA-binding antitoxin AbrB/MazE fold protein